MPAVPFIGICQLGRYSFHDTSELFAMHSLIGSHVSVVNRRCLSGEVLEGHFWEVMIDEWRQYFANKN